MADGRLVIGTKMYSSWSLRGWLAVHLAGLDVEEVLIPLAGGNTAAIKEATPSGTVPYLEHKGAKVWESLAIIEYCAEIAPKLWPKDRVARAAARSMAAEMHSGFRPLRQAMPMTILRSFPGQGATPEALADVARIDAMWQEALAKSGGPFLFGTEMSGADIMFAPVVWRFLTWKPALSEASETYVRAMRTHPLMVRWHEEATREPADWRLPKYETPEA